MICWFDISSNDVSRNAQFVYLLSMCPNSPSGFFIRDLNIRDSIACYIAKRVIPSNIWHFHDDPYQAPRKYKNK
jgi:hypothetical protein